MLVEAAGFPAAEKDAVTAPADGVAIQVDGEGSSVVGRVFAAGAPTAGARVLLAPDTGGPVRETTTRAGGGFAFGGLGAGRYALRAATAELASPVVRGVEAGDGQSAAATRLDMVAGQAIAGRVVDDAGTALAGVDVRIEAGGAVPGEDPLPTLVSSDAAGAFAARVAPGRYRLTASRPGYVLRRAPSVDDKTPAAPPVALELVRGARVAGRVLDGRGGPAAGATVRCVASAIEDLTVQIGPLPLAAEAAALPSGAGRALGSTRVAVADRNGAFRRRRSHPRPLPIRDRAPRIGAAAQRRVRPGAWRAPRRGEAGAAPGIPGGRARDRRERRPHRRRPRRGRQRCHVAGVDGPVRAHELGWAVRAGAARGRLPADDQRRRTRRDAGRRSTWSRGPRRRRSRSS